MSRSPMDRRSLRILCRTAVFAFFAAAAAVESARAEDWPVFRGGRLDGASGERGVFSGGEPVGLEIAWKKKLGSGYSGVVISGDHVVTAVSDGTNDVLVNLNAKTGEERWRFELGETYRGHDGSHDGPIATPVIADGRVFMLAPRGRFVGVGLEKGDLLWSTDLVKDHGVKDLFYGFGTSPVVAEGVVVLQLGGKDAAVAGFSPDSGEKLWSVGTDGVAYQTPIVLDWKGHPAVIAAGSRNLLAVAPRSGEVLWQYEHTPEGSRGSPSLVPVPTGKDALFLAHQGELCTVVRLGEDGDTVKVEPVWQNDEIRSSYNIAVHHDGHVYAYRTRFLTCVDAATGENKWRSRWPGDGFLILVDGHLVIVTKKGTLHVVKADPAGYEEVAAIDALDDLAWTHPSFAHGSIYLRGLGEVARVDIKRGATAVAKKVPVEGKLPDSEFGQFVALLEQAPRRDREIDQYFAAVKKFPVIEGNDTIHFVYYGEGEDLGIGGDMFGARQDRPMNRVPGTSLFYYSMRAEPDARFNYVFMRDYETITDPRNERTTSTNLLNSEMEMSFSGGELPMSWVAMPKWEEPTCYADVAESRRGKLETRKVESKVLEKELELQVYLPAGYEGSDQRYPVAYVHVGGDAIKHGEYPKALDNLIGKQVEPLIAVFLDESSFRQNDKYAQMVVEEVVPYIDENFRTQPEATSRACIGAGFAGADAWYIALKHPKVVGKVGTQSMFLFGSHSPDVAGQLTSPGEQPIKAYMDWGKYDFRNPHEAWDMSERNRQFAAALKEKGFRFSGGEVNDGTGWSSWRNRTDDLFRALFPAD